MKTAKRKTTKKKKKMKPANFKSAAGLVMIPVPAALAYQIGLIIGREVIQVTR